MVTTIKKKSPSLSNSQVDTEQEELHNILFNISNTKCNLQTKIDWSFHDAMDFAQSIITTVGKI